MVKEFFKNKGYKINNVIKKIDTIIILFDWGYIRCDCDAELFSIKFWSSKNNKVLQDLKEYRKKSLCESWDIYIEKNR